MFFNSFSVIDRLSGRRDQWDDSFEALTELRRVRDSKEYKRFELLRKPFTARKGFKKKIFGKPADYLHDISLNIVEVEFRWARNDRLL
jgi:hypothetical protein